MAGRRILFFTPGGDARCGGVFASQVTGLARYCVQLGAETLIFHRTKGDRQDCEEFERGIRLLSIDHWYPSTNLFNVAKVYRKEAEPYWQRMVDFKPTHIYVRSYVHCLVARELADQTGAKLIYSMRGPDAYEIRKPGGWKNLLRSIIVEHGVRKAMRICDGFTSMSYAAIKWCAAQYGVYGHMIPCCVADDFFRDQPLKERKDIRTRLGFTDNDRVIVWSGSPAYWQCLDGVVELLKGLCARDRSIRVLFLAYRMEEFMRELCVKHSFDPELWRVTSLPQPAVAGHLKACDVGIDVLAVDDFKSAICCPVKVGEYLACGLPVLITRTMGDVPDLIRKYAVGEVLNDDLQVDDAYLKLKRALNVDVSSAKKCAKEFFGWDSQRGAVETLFA